MNRTIGFMGLLVLMVGCGPATPDTPRDRSLGTAGRREYFCRTESTGGTLPRPRWHVFIRDYEAQADTVVLTVTGGLLSDQPGPPVRLGEDLIGDVGGSYCFSIPEQRLVHNRTQALAIER